MEGQLSMANIHPLGRVRNPGMQAVGTATYTLRQADSKLYERIDVIVGERPAVIYRVTTTQRPRAVWKVRLDVEATVFDEEFPDAPMHGTPVTVEASNEDWATISNLVLAPVALTRRVNYVLMIQQGEEEEEQAREEGTIDMAKGLDKPEPEL